MTAMSVMIEVSLFHHLRVLQKIINLQLNVTCLVVSMQPINANTPWIPAMMSTRTLHPITHIPRMEKLMSKTLEITIEGGGHPKVVHPLLPKDLHIRDTVTPLTKDSHTSDTVMAAWNTQVGITGDSNPCTTIGSGRRVMIDSKATNSGILTTLHILRTCKHVAPVL